MVYILAVIYHIAPVYITMVNYYEGGGIGGILYS